MPLLRAGGYRVVFPDSEQAAHADIIVRCDGGSAEILPDRAETPVIRLTTEPDSADPDLVYRYDRTRLLDAMRDGIRRGGAR